MWETMVLLENKVKLNLKNVKAKLSLSPKQFFSFVSHKRHEDAELNFVHTYVICRKRFPFRHARSDLIATDVSYCFISSFVFKGLGVSSSLTLCTKIFYYTAFHYSNMRSGNLTTLNVTVNGIGNISTIKTARFSRQKHNEYILFLIFK